MRDLAHVLAWIEQHRQRRIADRPALHLVHRIIDEEQRLAVADDEDRHALFVLEADLAGLLERSEEHTSELQSLMRISYAVFCLKKKKKYHKPTYQKTRIQTQKTKNIKYKNTTSQH